MSKVLVPCHLTWEWPTSYSVFVVQIWVNNALYCNLGGPSAPASQDSNTTIWLPSNTKLHIELVTQDYTHFRNPFPHTSNSAAIDVTSP